MSIALAERLNPSTMAPAIYLTTIRRPRPRVAEFAAGVFVVNMVGGALFVLGPGQLILSAVPRTSHQAKHVIELVIGLALLVFAALLVIGHHGVAAPDCAHQGGRAGSASMGARGRDRRGRASEPAGPRIEPRLDQIGDWLQERWPTVFAILAGAVGVGLTVVGVVGVLGFP